MADNYIDVKETIWRRYHFSDEADMQKVIEELKEDSFDIFDIDGAKFQESEILYDTGVSLTPEENNREPTIEVYSEKESSSAIKILESMLTMIDSESSIITTDDGIEYSISYKFIKEQNKLVVFGVPYENINKHNNYNPLTGNKNQIISLIVINIILSYYLYIYIDRIYASFHFHIYSYFFEILF